MEPETPRDRSSLRDVAKFAAPAGMTSPGGNAKSGARRMMTADSSGVVDLEALMKEHPTWLDDALSRAKGGTAPQPDRAALPGSSSPALAGPALLAPPSLAPTAFDDIPVGVPRNNRVLIAASVGALLLIGAASVFTFRSPAKEVAPAAPVAAAVLAPVASPDTRAEDPIPPPPPVSDIAAATAPQAPAAAAPTAKEDDTAAEPSEAEAAPRRGRHSGHAVHHAALHASVAEAALAPAPAAKPVRGGSALDAALRNAMGPAGAIPAVPGGNAPAPAAAAAPAAAPASNRPDTPSPSAVKSALTGAMAAAHGCLSGSEPSHARVTFGSNGNVQSVDITGPAASDRKAVSCVKSAFNRAHVPAFSQPSYSAGVTIRPQ